jgi:hypothetical protein
VLNNPAGQIDFKTAQNFPYSAVITFGPNDAPDNGQTLASGCAVNSTTLIGPGKCDTGGAPNAAGTVIWIAVTFEPNATGNVTFGSPVPLSEVTGLQPGNYTYIAYRGTAQVASGAVNLVGAQYTFVTPFINTTVPDNTPTTIEVIRH